MAGVHCRRLEIRLGSRIFFHGYNDGIEIFRIWDTWDRSKVVRIMNFIVIYRN